MDFVQPYYNPPGLTDVKWNDWPSDNSQASVYLFNPATGRIYGRVTPQWLMADKTYVAFYENERLSEFVTGAAAIKAVEHEHANRHPEMRSQPEVSSA